MSDELNSVKKNYILQVLYQILNMCLPFVTSPYISRILGAEKLGVYSYTCSIASVFVLFIHLGIEKYGSRTVAAVKQDGENLEKTFSELLFLHLALGLFVSALYFAWVFIFPEEKLFFYLQGFLLAGAALDINWFFFGMEKFKVTVTRNFIFKICTVLCIFLFVKEEGDLWKYVFIMAFGTALSQSAVWVILHRYVSVVKVKCADVVKHIRPMSVLFVAVLAQSAYTYIDKIMLGRLGDMEQLGFCENAYKIIAFPMGVITSLGVVMLPRMSILFKQEEAGAVCKYIRNSMRFVMMLAIGMAGGMMAVGREFAVIFWGPEFIASGRVIVLIAPIVVFMSWSDVIRNQYLIPQKLDKKYAGSIVAGAAVNIVCNAVFIPWLGAYGAAAGTFLSYLAIALYQTLAIRGALPFGRFAGDALPFIFCSLVMAAGVRLILSHFAFGSLQGLVAAVAGGVCIYGCLVAVYFLLYERKRRRE